MTKHEYIKGKNGVGSRRGGKKHTKRAAEGNSHRHRKDKIKYIFMCSMVFCFQYLLFQADAFN